MLNSNELYDPPHPTLAKIIYVGGLAMKQKDAKPLSEVDHIPGTIQLRIFQEFSSRIENARGIVVMTFGSYSPMYLMPQT